MKKALAKRRPLPSQTRSFVTSASAPTRLCALVSGPGDGRANSRTIQHITGINDSDAGRYTGQGKAGKRLRCYFGP